MSKCFNHNSNSISDLLASLEGLLSVLTNVTGNQRHSQGGPGVPVTPRFCKPFLTKQPTKGGENAMTISWPQLKTPFFETFSGIDMTIW